MPSTSPGPAKAFHAGSVRLVVAGFEDVGNAEVADPSLDSLCHSAHMGLRLNDARTGNQK